jgi:hypothetical protein
MTYAIAVSFLGFVQEYNPRFALARLQQLSANEDVQITWQPVFYPVCARDLAVAGGVISKNPNEQMIFLGALVPRRIVALWLEMVQGNHPTWRTLPVRVNNFTEKSKQTEPTLSCWRRLHLLMSL